MFDNSVKDLRNRFPFKIGTTSYVLPVKEDNLLENVRFLKESFDMVQLLYFGRNHLGEVMSKPIIRGLKAIREESGIIYTVHLPSDLGLLNRSDDAVRASIDLIERIMEETEPLAVEGYVLHVDRFEECVRHTDPGTEDRGAFEAALGALSGRMGGEARNIYLENTSYDLTLFKDVMLAGPFPVCMDAGHLFFYGHDYNGFIDAFGPRIRQVHLHGYLEGRDHRAVSELDRAALGSVARFMKGANVPLILEVYTLDDLVQSVEQVVRLFG